MDIKKRMKQQFMEFLKKLYPSETDQGLDPFDYVVKRGDPIQALLCSAVFMPELTEFRQSVLIKEAIDTDAAKNNFIRAQTKDGWILEELEASFNYIELYQLFTGIDRLSQEEVIVLAYRIRDSWEGWLKICYPDRKFNVRVLENGEGPFVEFYEIR